MLGFYEAYLSETRASHYQTEYHPDENHGESPINITLHWLDLVNVAFTFVFILEALLKLLNHGLFLHKRSYLRESLWNWIELAVIITG
jgi:hypothetical protein